MITVATFLVLACISPDFLASCQDQFGDDGGIGQVEILASGTCDVLATDEQPLVNLCDISGQRPLAEIKQIASSNSPAVARHDVEWAMWRDGDGIVTVCIEGAIGEYEKALIWAVRPIGPPSRRWTTWGIASGEGADAPVTRTVIHLDGSRGDAEARQQLPLLEELKILKFGAA